MNDAFKTDALSSLRSKDQLSLLDEIDALSRSNIREHISLPEIAVCGDQSSGKSSCLEAISGIPFPRKDTLCTRFATELVLRKSAGESVAVSIVPGLHRSEVERKNFKKFEQTLQSFDELPGLMESAKVAMGLEKAGTGFSSDVLRIEISGPSRPHLTVIDLPGLIHAKNDDQDDENVEEVVSELVYSYMQRPRTIILAVVSALSDRALQAVLKRAKIVDPYGRRTMGLITKPDTLPEGSDSEAEFVKLAMNEKTQFRLGWHVLRNRDFNTRDASTTERDRIEEDFFSHGAWKTLPRGLLGISKLRERLSEILLDHIKSELPALMSEIEATLSETQQALARLGDERNTVEKQRMYLLKHSQSFTTICNASCDGIYEDSFFGELSDAQSRSRRFRAVVQNLNLEFEKEVRKNGRHMKLLGEGTEGKSEEAISWARDVLSSSRGRELPGTFNPLLVGDLFRVQSKPWEKISSSHVMNILRRAKKHVEDILSTLLDPETRTALLVHSVDPAIGKISKTASDNIDSLFRDRLRHSITYNHYFTTNIQASFNDRNEGRLREILDLFFPVTSSHNNERRVGPVNLSAVLESFSQTVEDMDTYASIQLLDHLDAFYKVAVKTFVDNVAIQVIERSIVSSLSDVFNPLAVAQMSDKLITTIGAESKDSQNHREILGRKEEVLKKGLEMCRRHARPNSGDQDSSPSDLTAPFSPKTLSTVNEPDDENEYDNDELDEDEGSEEEEL